MTKCNSFIRSLKRNFKGVKYIKTIECFKKQLNRFHIHMLVIFPNSIPKEFNKKWVEKHWKYGKQIDLKKAYDPYGAIDYMTQYKECNINQENKGYTKYPEWVKFITNSQDIPKSTKREFEVSKEELPKTYFMYENEYKEKYGKEPYCFSDGHYYMDSNEDKTKYCLDKEFIH